MTISLEEHVARAIESTVADAVMAACITERTMVHTEAIARAAIAAMREREGKAVPNFWQPISTAPKDGTQFVALSQDMGGNDLPPFVSLCAWHPDAGFCTDELREPTHWMSIPNLTAPDPAEAMRVKCEWCEGSGNAFNAIDCEWDICLYCGGSGTPRAALKGKP
jgi:hypothetical protein